MFVLAINFYLLLKFILINILYHSSKNFSIPFAIFFSKFESKKKKFFSMIELKLYNIAPRCLSVGVGSLNSYKSLAGLGGIRL